MKTSLLTVFTGLSVGTIAVTFFITHDWDRCLNRIAYAGLALAVVGACEWCYQKKREGERR